MGHLQIKPEPFLGTQPAGVLEPQNTYHDAAWELLAHQCDYAVVDERFIQEGRIENGVLRIGPALFRTVIAPRIRLLEKTTWQRLAELAGADGTVLMLGDGPAVIVSPRGETEENPATPDRGFRRFADPQAWLAACVSAAEPLLHGVEDYRNLYVQGRDDGPFRRLLLANLEAERRVYRFRLDAPPIVAVYDPWTGSREETGREPDGTFALAIDGGSSLILEYARTV